MVKKAAQARPNDLLRAARKERGWTQKDVADRIGAPLSLNITRWEGGTAFPSAHYVEKLCLLFGKSARELGLIQDEHLEIPVSTDDAIATGNQPFLPPQPARRNLFRPKILLPIGLVLLIVIVSTGIFYATYVNRNQSHRVPTPTRTIPVMDDAATAHAAATATLSATYPDPYPPRSGKLAFYDPLSGPYLWRNETNSSFGTICQFKQGVYHVSESHTNNAGTCFNTDFDGHNIAIEVQMKIVEGDCGGIIFRSNEPEDYQLAVCQDGYYYVNLYKGYSDPKMLVEKFSPAVTIGQNQLNVIAIVANGNTFDLYANQQKIDTIHDSSYSHGQIALIAVCNSAAFTEVTYSHIKVWTL
jgi:transcriptional regulator with XRE-family HTH domain